MSAGRARRRSHGYRSASRSRSPRGASSRGMRRERPSFPPSDRSLQPWLLPFETGCTGPGVDLCLPPLHASRADARWRFRAFGRRFRLQGQWTEGTPLLDGGLRATRDFTRAKNDVRLWLRRCEDVQGEERADDVLPRVDDLGDLEIDAQARE